MALRMMNESSDFITDRVTSELLVETTLKSNGEFTLLLEGDLLEELLHDYPSGCVCDANLTCVLDRDSVDDVQGITYRASSADTEIPVHESQFEKANWNNASDRQGILLQGHEHIIPRSFSSIQSNPELSSSNLQCHYNCVRGNDESPRPAYTFDFIFCLALTLISIARAFYSSANSLTDAVTYGLLGSNRHQWGRQRLWGTLGTAAVALAFTSLNDRVAGEGFRSVHISSSSSSSSSSFVFFFQIINLSFSLCHILRAFPNA